MKHLAYHIMIFSFIFSNLFSQEIFNSPDVEKKIFDIEKISLTKEEKAEMATAIGSYVRDTQNTVSKKGLLQAAKLIGIALRLDDKNRETVIINSKLKRGVKDPQVVSQDKGLPVLNQILLKHAKKLKIKSEDNDKKLACYLLELIVDLEPKNDDAAYELETMVDKTKCDWTWASQEIIMSKENPSTNELPNQNPAKSNDPTIANVKNNQSSVKGLIVFSQESGKMYGATLDIIMTFTPNNNRVEFLFQKEKKIGQDMVDSCNEALNYVKTKYLYIQKGEYRISFGDRYSDKDGGSAGAAFTLIALSLFDGFKIDPKCSITGDISVDGKIRTVGGVIEKIHGAQLDKCTITCIPNKNAVAFRDFVILYGLSAVKDIQVFCLNHIDDAKRIMALEKDPVVVSAINEFNEICKNVNFIAPLMTTDKINITKQLEDLKAKVPEYENVSYLLDVLSNKADRNLSLITSFERVFTSTDAFLPFLNEKVPRTEIINERVYGNDGRIVMQKREIVTMVDSASLIKRENLSATLAKNTLEELNTLKNITHPKLKPFTLELINFVTNIDKAIDERDKNRRITTENSYYLKKVASSRVILKKMLSEFKGDEKLIEKFFRSTLQ